MTDNQGITPPHLRNLGNLPQPPLSNKPNIDIKEEIARMFAWCDSGAEVNFRHRKFAEQALQALYQRLLEVIGADEPETPAGVVATRNMYRNELRAAQRKALAELMGIKE